MSEAKLSIEIRDVSGGGHAPGAPSSPSEKSADAAWVAAAAARARAEEDYYRRAASGSGAGRYGSGAAPAGGGAVNRAGGTPPAPVGGLTPAPPTPAAAPAPVGGLPFGQAGPPAPVGGLPPGPSAPSGSPSGPPSPAGRAWSDLDFDSKRRAALNGRPEGVTDTEWAAYGRENARRGSATARVSMRATDQRQKQEAEFEAMLAEAQERLRKEQEQRDKIRQAQTAQFVGVGARAVLGGGANKYQSAGGQLGSMAGQVLGAEFGPVGSAIGGAVGQQVGEKVGARLDDPMLELTKTARVAGEAIEFLGRESVKVAGGDGVGLFRDAVGVAAKGLEDVPIAGKAAAESLRTVGKAVGAIKDVTDAFANRGRELSGYNGALASSIARQDVVSTMSDIREAQMLGDKYAKLIDAQTRFDETIKAGLLPVKEAILEILPKLLDATLTGFQELVKVGYLVPGVSDKRIDEIVTNTGRTRAALEDRTLGTDDWKEVIKLPHFEFAPPDAVRARARPVERTRSVAA